MFLEQRPQGKILRARAGPVEKHLHAVLRDIAAGGKVGLMPDDLAPLAVSRSSCQRSPLELR
jgi:hypothetical protein